ncbi:MAG: alpha/beta hydrolase family protein [Acidimicrobiia bacterium]
MSLETAYQGPKRGADRAVLLAHGAGADMNTKALTTVADALADAKIPSLRFNFPYMSAGRRAPDRPPVLEAAVREAAAELAARTKLSLDQIVLAGRSMGGRICSLVVADANDPVPARALVLLGYPLHPPGKPDVLRTEHFPRIRVPCLFVSGTRDAFGTPDELKRHAERIKGEVAWHWIDTGDHGFKPLKASGVTPDAALAAVAATVVAFVGRDAVTTAR